MNRDKRERRWQSPRDRARVAAELIEEAESLSDTALIATPADLVKAAKRPPIHIASDVDQREPEGDRGHDRVQGRGTSGSTPVQPDPPPPGVAVGTPALTAALPAVDTAPADVQPARESQLSVAARKARTAQEREGVLAALDGAINGGTGDASLLLSRGTLLAAMGNFGAAQRDLLQALGLAPEDAETLTALGHVLSRRGLWAEAAAYLRRAVAASPDHSDAWYHLGEALNHVDDLSGALAAFTRATELQPTHSKALHGQGIVLDRLNRPEDATRMYRRAREVARR